MSLIRFALPVALLAGLAAAQPANAAAPTAKITSKVLQITGDSTAQKIALRNLATDHTRLLIDVGDDGTAEFNFSRTAFAKIEASLGGGNDSLRVDDVNGTVTVTRPLTVDAGPGNDTIRGGAGAETVLGGDGNDVAIARAGNDVVLLGAGDDETRWAPGDGNDTLEGQDGEDRLSASGSTANERFDVAAGGARVRLTRDISSVVLDADGIERIGLNASRGADALAVHDLSGTDVDTINANAGGADGATDTIQIDGSAGDDAVSIAGDSSGLQALGLHARVNVTGTEAADDTLAVKLFSGADVADAGALTAGVVKLTADAGDDDDVLIGSDGADTLLGGAGDDVLIGGLGADTLDGGAGDNVVIQ